MGSRIDRFNRQVAEIVTTVTGNMWFFWSSLGFIILLRALYPPKPQELLLNLENDLQLLLLAANAVVSGAQFALLLNLVRRTAELTAALTQLLRNQADTMESIQKILERDLAADEEQLRLERERHSRQCRPTIPSTSSPAPPASA